MAFIVMTSIGIAFTVTGYSAHVAMALKAMAHIVMAHIVAAYVVTASIGMACVVMADTVTVVYSGKACESIRPGLDSNDKA